MFEKLFLQILNMSFTASFVIFVVMAARLLLKKTPRVISYALWAVVLFRLVCPFSFESAISLLPVNANPIPQEIVYQQTPQINTGIPFLNDSVNAVLPAATPAASMNPLQGWVAIGTFLWLGGIAVLAIYSIVSLLLLKRKLRGAIWEGGNVYLVKGLASPFVMGLFRPKIYLPAHLTEDERRYILLHEQTHIKRLDHVVKIVSFSVLCLHWFNPLVWIAFFLCGKDIEMSCDEAVIKRLGSEVKKEYSTSLLMLATGRRIVGGSPLAFGEGDTKSRIKNVLNYKKPVFWVVVLAVVAVAAVGIGLMANPQQKTTGFAGVNAIILEIDKKNQSMVVRGIDQDSVIGDKCVVDLEGASLITVATSHDITDLSLDDFAIGDTVALFIGVVQESYPTGAKATTVQLQPKEIALGAYSARDLWNARTEYIGNNSAISRLISLLPLPDGLTYDHFELHTDKVPYGVEIVYSASDETLQTYDVDGMQIPSPFRKNALLMLALIDNAGQIQATLTNGTRKVGFVNGREWAEYTVGEDVRAYAQSAEKLQKLIDFPLTEDEYDWMEAVTSSYYAGQGSRAFNMLQKSVFQNWVEYDNSGALNAGLVNPKWNFDSFTQYDMLDQNMDSTSDQELYYCTFLDDNGKCGYVVVAYQGESLSKIDRVETPHLYDLQANIDDITAKLSEAGLDLSTAVAARVRIADESQNTTREAIRIADGNANQYLYYFDDLTTVL